MIDKKNDEQDDYSAFDDVLPGLTWVSILDSVTDMVGVLNTDAQCVWVNAVFADYVGRSPKECIGELFYKLLRLDKLKRSVEAATARPVSNIYTDPVALNRIQCCITPVLLKPGTVSGFIFVARDMTDVLLQEESLKMAMERELRARNKNEVFSSKLSCEFRTALTGIIGMTQFLRDTHLDDEQADYTATLDSCSKKLLSLIDGLIYEEEAEEGVEQYPEFGGTVSDAVVLGPDEADEPGVNLKGMRILLVEDNLVNRKVVCKMLEGLGGTVDVATDGRMACDQVDSNEYDLVLMDCEMPLMDGYTATRRIRESGKNELPIIALTAHATEEAQRLCEEVGMDAYMSKPIRKEQMCDVICQVLLGRKKAGEQIFLGTL